MVFSWPRRRQASHKKRHGNSDEELVVPSHFICPISLDLMKDPVTLCSGITYDRENIEAWLESGNFTCPVTNETLTSFDQIPNHTLRIMIQDWCVDHRKHGFERIPTPRVPVSSFQVSDTLVCIDASSKRLDKNECLQYVQKIKKWGSESERNRRCIIANGASGVLAKAFDAFAKDSIQQNGVVLEEILSAMTWVMCPVLDVESQVYLGTAESLRSMLWFIEEHTDLSTKENSVTAMKELICSDQKHAQTLASIEGVDEVLFKLVKEPICTKITKASLTVMFNLLSSKSSSGNIKSRFMKMGLVSLLIEIIIDSEKSICERALGVFDELCECEEGREEAYNNELTLPVLVKKILRVSEVATEYSVSSIWKLNKHRREDKCLVEALQVGAFQKLVLLLQIGCGDNTKEKATELLKLMNPYRNGLECIESVDFKHLKRSF